MDQQQEVPQQDLPEQQPAASPQAQEVPHEDLPAQSGQEVPPEDHPVDTDKYDNPTQHLVGAAEAAGRGASFGLSTLAEQAMGVPKEDIKGREQNLDPNVALGSEAVGAIGSMLIPGVGEGWLLGKGATIGAKVITPFLNEANVLAKVGRLAVRGMLEMSGFAAGDEISDALLDKGHDAEAVASHIVGAGAVGFLTGGIFGTGTKLLEAAQDANLGKYLDNFAIGIGAASKGEERVAALRAMHEEFGEKVPKAIEHGIKFYADAQKVTGKAVADAASEAVGAVIGNTVGGLPGALVLKDVAKKYLDPYAEKIASKVAPVAAKNVGVPIMLAAIKTGEHTGLSNALNYGTKMAKGSKMLNGAIEDLFNIGGKEALHAMEPDNDKLDKYIQDGGIDQQIQDIQDTPPVPRQGLAEGGKVEPKPIQSTGGVAALYPAQHQMLTATKGRVSNYLNSVRPQEPQGMVYDTPHKDAQKERTYRSALSIANAPLSVISHIKHGTVTMEHVKHLNSMYPELHDHLSKKITETMMKHQYDEEKRPNYKIRQGLAMFMGSALDSTMTPQSIQAAQSTFLSQQSQQQPQQAQKNKKSTSSLSKTAKEYQTPSQSRESRESKD